MCLQQVEQPFAWLVATDEQDIGRAVLPAGDRHRSREAGDIDAVGDDLVVAGEEPVDEVPRGGTHGDAAVELGRMSLHDPAAQLVGRREAGIRVERGDVDTLRFAQQEERQEGDERFVEMEDIEAFTREQLADLAEIPR